MSFEKMRAALVERGVIRKDGGGYRITDAGMSETDALIAKLKTKQARSIAAAEKTVRWNW